MPTIETGIPLPPVPGRPTTPFARTLQSMRAGDSVLLADDLANVPVGSLHNIARHHGIKIAYRKTSDGVRVWRTA